MWLQIILFIFGFLFVVGLIIYQILISTREGKLKGVRINAPEFKNYARRDFTDGHFEGKIVRELPRKNSCSLIEFIPTDWERGEGKKPPAMQSVVYHNSKLKHLARGEMSSETEQVWGLWDNPTEIINKLQGTPFGEYLKGEAQLAFLKRTFGNRTKETLITAGHMIEETTELGLTHLALANLKEKNRELEKLVPQILQREESKEEKK